jgi:3-oxoacyl-[acyl-carrier-protein] synthase II
MSDTKRVRVVVTGVGMVTPLGHSTEETWTALLAGRSGAGPITAFDVSAMATRFACEVKDWDASKRLGNKLVRELDRFSEFAIVAADEALAQAGLHLEPSAEERAGCLVGTGVGGTATIEAAAVKLASKVGAKLSPYVVPAMAANLAAGQIAIRHKLRGPGYAIASACATGSHSLGEAAEWIRRGHADVMVAGSSEAPITPVGIGGFSAMRALSTRNAEPQLASRPFDRERDGFVAGEGAAILVLERYEHATARGAKILAELSGYGASVDAFHIAAPTADGEGLARSMRMALADASLGPRDLDLLSAHATSTPLGDVAEARAVRAVFGEARPLTHATKAALGHTLGAAGAVASAIMVLALSRQTVPPTINVREKDPDIDLEIVAEPTSKRVRAAMINASGFGGVNASLVFSEG